MPYGTILVDMDGVLCDVVGGMLDELEHLTGVDMEKRPVITDYALSGSLFEANPTTSLESWNDAIRDTFNLDGFFFDLEPIGKAVEATRELVSEGWEVFLCTSPWPSSPSSYSDKQEWVAEHMPFIDLRNLIMTQDKSMVVGDVLIDDKPMEINRLRYNPVWTHVVFDTPYNWDHNTGFRVYDTQHTWISEINLALGR